MQQIIDFFIRNKNFLLFLLLFSFGISLSQKAHSGLYTRNIASSNRISGSIFAQITDIKSYFSLKQRNETLALENARLLAAKHKIKHSDSKDTLSKAGLMPLLDSSNLSVIQAHVINNNYHKRKNTLTIDKGTLDGVEMDMGVVSSNSLHTKLLNSCQV